jgi:4-amino-4-deoxy-L-arabinose transferase-like glycosyltransferase
MVTLAFPEGMGALFLTTILALGVIYFIHRYAEEKIILTRIFLVALMVRIIFGLFIHIFELRAYFGGDAETYDALGNRIVEIWFGIAKTDKYTAVATITSGPGWSMKYLVAIIYIFTGQNVLAAQSVCGVIGAATAPMGYICTKKIFNNHRTSVVAAFLMALFPALVIWSSQLLKDGIVIFFLVLSMTLVLQLQEKFDYMKVALLVFSLFAITSLRFYIFYMATIAIASSFIIGMGSASQSIVKRVVVVFLVGLALAYIGVLRSASDEFEQYGSLEKIQVSRGDLARSDSGFGEDLNVSTTAGAITALPVGFAYLMLAPFPWQINSSRASLTVPDILMWWSSIPLLVIGFLFTLKHRLRKAIPILAFTLMLTLGYSLFQGNVGTAYRQRTQIQVFLFIFVAVGWTLRKEQRENRVLQRKEQMKQFYLKASKQGLD